ncbi:hypothetical protein [Desulfoferula mesophila]|uniref:Abi-like protein n=1 Tax=Desulfoferula mesophila TaxID=3058419 RepID=A0AAU9EKS0_9BACT|nr:hypothetical protein FAK_28300 [Desulfoferula mesophilus]
MNKKDVKEENHDKQYQKYLFYKVYTIDFDTALRTLRVLSRYRKNDVRYCLLRDIVITYCRPFSKNKGSNFHNSLRSKKFVPQIFLPFHTELMAVRNQLFAHTDLTYYRPQVVNWSTPGQIRFPMAFKGYDYAKLNARVSEIKKLVNSVAQKLQNEIDQMEKIYAQNNFSKGDGKLYLS